MKTEIPFAADRLFCYREKEKMRTGMILITVPALVFFVGLLLAIMDLLPLNSPEGFGSRLLGALSDAVLGGKTYGVLLVAFCGGLFFLFLPLELIFMSYLKMGLSPVTLYFLFFIVQIPAQSLNYAVGFRLNRLSKLMIPPQKFYRLKGLVNRYGPFAVFFINALPLPSPVLSAVLGVFRYRLSRFYVYTLTGQLALYGMLILIHKFFPFKVF